MDPEQTATNWRTQWAQCRAWVEANPKAARAILMAGIVVAAFIAGAVIF